MISSIKKRLNIIKRKITNDEYIKYSRWEDVAHEVLKQYGRCKEVIRKNMTIKRFEDMQAVEIERRIIYWPLRANVSRLVDMYFEVFNEDNNHCFDIPEMKIKSGDVVVDCGACEGYFTLKALESGAAKVYCIEPGEAISECLHKTFATDVADGKVFICSCLVGDKNEVVTFFENPSDPTVCQINLQGNEILSNVGSLDREMMTLDEFCQKNSIDQVDFLKADVEGGEVKLVYGAEKTIRKCRPNIAIAVYHAPENANLIITFIENLFLDYKIRVKGIVDFDGVPRPVMVHCYHT